MLTTYVATTPNTAAATTAHQWPTRLTSSTMLTDQEQPGAGKNHHEPL